MRQICHQAETFFSATKSEHLGIRFTIFPAKTFKWGQHFASPLSATKGLQEQPESPSWQARVDSCENAPSQPQPPNLTPCCGKAYTTYHHCILPLIEVAVAEGSCQFLEA